MYAALRPPQRCLKASNQTCNISSIIMPPGQPQPPVLILLVRLLRYLKSRLLAAKNHQEHGLLRLIDLLWKILRRLASWIKHGRGLEDHPGYHFPEQTRTTICASYNHAPRRTQTMPTPFSSNASPTTGRSSRRASLPYSPVNDSTSSFVSDFSCESPHTAIDVIQSVSTHPSHPHPASANGGMRRTRISQTMTSRTAQLSARTKRIRVSSPNHPPHHQPTPDSNLLRKCPI